MGNLVEKLKSLFSGRQLELVLVGLEGAGKSTLAAQLSFERPTEKGPTIGVDIKTLKRENVTMKVWDLGGQVQYRSEWAKYAIGCDAIIYVLDTHDKARTSTAKFELHKMLDSEYMKGIPLLVIGNKIDLPGNLSKNEIIERNLIRTWS